MLVEEISHARSIVSAAGSADSEKHSARRQAVTGLVNWAFLLDSDAGVSKHVLETGQP
jgi:hypothetical protein